MKIKDEKIEDIQKKLIEKIFELRNTIEEEFDLMEVIDDNIKDIFNCDLDCSTCTEEEKGECMQNFKKANIYWIRKSVQDRERLHLIVEKLDKSFDLLKEYSTGLKTEEKDKKKEDFKRKNGTIGEEIGSLYS